MWIVLFVDGIDFVVVFIDDDEIVVIVEVVGVWVVCCLVEIVGDIVMLESVILYVLDVFEDDGMLVDVVVFL